MGAQAYDFLNIETDPSSVVITVADGSFYTAGLPETEDESEVYFEFFSDAQGLVPVTPTGGTIVTSGRPMTANFLAAGSNATTNAADCQTPDSGYTPPILDGKTNRAKITLSGIQGAAYMRAQIYKHV